MWRDRLWTLANSALVAPLPFVAVAVWWQTPELHVDTGSRPAQAHMELMGEYPSDIRRIEIVRDDTSAPVWKIVAVGDLFQIHAVPLVVGDNPVDVHLFSGQARPAIPAAGRSFRLEAATAYRITICPSAWLGLCRSAPFVLPAR